MPHELAGKWEQYDEATAEWVAATIIVTNSLEGEAESQEALSTKVRESLLRELLPSRGSKSRSDEEREDDAVSNERSVKIEQDASIWHDPNEEAPWQGQEATQDQFDEVARTDDSGW